MTFNVLLKFVFSHKGILQIYVTWKLTAAHEENLGLMMCFFVCVKCFYIVHLN